MKTHSFATAHPAAEYLRSVHAAELAQEKADEAAKKQLWKRSRAGRGMLIGGVAGAVAGGALGRMAGQRGISGALLGGALGATGGEIAGALVRRNPKNDLSALVQGMIALERRTDAILFGVDLKREPLSAPSNSPCCDSEKPSYPTVFLRLEGEKAASLAHIKNGDEVILKGKVVSVGVRERQGDIPTSSRSVDIECHELLPDAPKDEEKGKEKKAAPAGKPVALAACDRLAEVVELALSSEEEKPSLLRRAAGALGTAALVGGAAYGANRFVQGRYGSQGLGSWGAAADEAKLRFRSTWGAPRAAITPPVAGASVSDYVAPGAIVPSNVKPSVGGIASTRKMAGNFKQVPAGTAAADARRVGRYTLQNVLRGPLLPKQRFSAADYLKVVFLDSRARNGDGQFEPGAQAASPEAMAAAYPATARPGVSSLIAASHRRRQKRDLMAGGIGAAAGAAVGAGAVPAWQYLRSVMGR